MARNFDPAKLASAWSSGMSGASQKYRDGVNAYDGNIATAAKARKGQMTSNWNASMADGGKWDNAIEAGARIWKNNAANIGANNLATGAQKGQPKMQRYFAAAAPIYQQLVAEVNQIADPKARMNAWFDGAKARLTGAGKS